MMIPDSGLLLLATLYISETRVRTEACQTVVLENLQMSSNRYAVHFSTEGSNGKIPQAKFPSYTPDLPTDNPCS